MRRSLTRVPVLLSRLRLRLDALLSRRGPDSGRLRVFALGTGVFPTYSHTFVYQEMCALAEHGFSLCVPYSTLDEPRFLAPRVSRLWRLKRRLWLGATSSADWRHYRRRMPERVAAVTGAVSAASGLSPEELKTHPTFLQAFTFARAAEAWRADYLHSYFFYDRTFFALVASWLLDIPHGVSCYADHVLADYPFKLVALNLSSCDVVVATSERIRRELEAIAGDALRPNIVVKPNAIDASEFAPAPGSRAARPAGTPVALSCVCRIDPKKGLSYLLDAVRLLLDAGVDVRLRVVGEPEAHLASSLAYARELRAQVVRLGLDEAVRFEGRRTPPEVRRLLQETDVFVAPFIELESGDKDGVPTALLEAMASGCAIVATDAGLILEVVDPGQTALVVPQRDAGALSTAIRTLVADPALGERLGRAGALEVALRFDVSTSEMAFHERIRRAVAARRSRRASPDAGRADNGTI